MRFIHPIAYAGQYRTKTWAGYVFKESLGYTTGVHTGTDYNGPGAGNADLGSPIWAIANGTVRYVGNRSDIGFGNTTILEIPLSDKLKEELNCSSLFARIMHQQEIHVTLGQEVNVGDGIGTVGNTGTQWAHTHLDLYKDTIAWGGVHFHYDKDSRLESYLDPFEFIEAHLADDTLTIKPTQRMVGVNGVNHREAPNTTAIIRKEWQKDEILDLKGYVHGESVNGNDIWFVGGITGGYLWSGAFTDASTHDLSDLTEYPNPVPTPLPDPAPAMFIPDSPLVTKVVPSPNILNEEITPEYIVIHHWDDPAQHPTLQGTLNHLTDLSVGISAHYVIDDSGIYQLVPEHLRAQHAGPQGNNHIGVELDPNGGPAMYANFVALRADIQQRKGKTLMLKKHSDFMQTECPGNIDMQRLEGFTPPANASQLDRIEDYGARTVAILEKVFK